MFMWGQTVRRAANRAKQKRPDLAPEPFRLLSLSFQIACYFRLSPKIACPRIAV